MQSQFGLLFNADIPCHSWHWSAIDAMQIEKHVYFHSFFFFVLFVCM